MKNVAKFLRPEPPEPGDANLLSALFVDRDDELQQAQDQVLAVRQGGIRRPLAVAGPARVGKSHLMLKIVELIGTEFDVVAHVRIETGLTDSKAVLREVFNQFRVRIGNAVLSKGLGTAETGALEALDAYIAAIQPAIYGDASAIEIKQARQVSQSIKSSTGVSGASDGLLALLPGLGAHATWDRESSLTVGDERTVTIPQLSEDQLTALVALTHDLARSADPNWTSLLVLDDFDLLKRDATGAFEPDPLMQALANLSREEGLFVLTTVREDTYYRHEKTFHRICALQPFENPDVLREIYDRQVAILYDGDDPFRGGFVEAAAERAQGRVGVFLRFLREAFTRLPPQRRALAEIDDVVGEWWETTLKDEPALGALVRQAVESRGGEVKGEPASRLRASGLRRFLIEDVTAENALSVDPIVLSVLRKKLSR